jgi:hypothetical protein
VLSAGCWPERVKLYRALQPGDVGKGSIVSAASVGLGLITVLVLRKDGCMTEGDCLAEAGCDWSQSALKLKSQQGFPTPGVIGY